MSLGIYIQVPFCQTKCTYCNFHAGPAAAGLYSPYARAVAREIAEHNALYHGANLAKAMGVPDQPVDTIYLGGGTPSLLDPADLATILDSVRASFPCQLDEVTLEADPETIRPENAAAWRAAGVNRVSLGAQSFHDPELEAAGRMHRRGDIGRAMQVLRAAGFENISLDLIAGLPLQTDATWRQSLEELLCLRPEHISIYLLEIDEGSRLGRESLAGGTRYHAAAIPSEDDMASFYELACETLPRAGYEHYEISNWGLPSRHSRHNLKYWRREPYLGFGAGAHSFAGGLRWANAHDPAAYLASIQQGRLPVEQREDVTDRKALQEEMFLGLRELSGVDLSRIERQYDVHWDGRIAELCAQGLLEREGPVVRLAPSRLALANEVFVAFLD